MRMLTVREAAAVLHLSVAGVLRDARDDIVEDRQRRLFAVEVEDDLGALPGHFNITVGGHRGELAQPRPASGRTSVALVPVAGYPLAQGAIERGRERLESRPQVVLCCCRSRRPARLGCMSGDPQRREPIGKRRVRVVQARGSAQRGFQPASYVVGLRSRRYRARQRREHVAGWLWLLVRGAVHVGPEAPREKLAHDVRCSQRTGEGFFPGDAPGVTVRLVLALTD